MLNIDISIKMNKINNNLQNAKISLNNARKKINNSITFNGIGFFSEEINSVINEINRQKNNLNKKIN